MSTSKSLLRTTNVHKNYKLIAEVGAGTYGRVYKAKHLKHDKFVALKKIEMSNKHITDGFPITTIREIKILAMVSHPNIIRLLEVVVSKPSILNDNKSSYFLVFEYMEHDFAGLVYRLKLSLPQIKGIMLQILQGLKYLHDNRIIHRDLKSANLLFNNKGEVKIADFGLGRLMSNQPEILYSHHVVTLNYRAPELLLGAKDYSTSIDMWSMGCIFAELLINEILFKGDKEPRLLEQIYKICGSPDTTVWAHCDKLRYWPQLKPQDFLPRRLNSFISDHCKVIEDEVNMSLTLDLIGQMLCYDPKTRISASQAIMHPWFSTVPLPAAQSDLPKLADEYHISIPNHMKKIEDIEKTKLQKIQDDKLNLSNYTKLFIKGHHAPLPPLPPLSKKNSFEAKERFQQPPKSFLPKEPSLRFEEEKKEVPRCFMPVPTQPEPKEKKQQLQPTSFLGQLMQTKSKEETKLEKKTAYFSEDILTKKLKQ